MAFNGFDLSSIQECYVGGTAASAIYYCSNLIWSASHDYSRDYLTFKVTSDGYINWKENGSGYALTIEYSVNNGTWTSITASSSAAINVYTGDVVRLRGNNNTYAGSNTDYSGFNGGTATFDVEGNIMSLLYGDNFIGNNTLTGTYTFCSILKNANVVSAENLILPATTLVSCCYDAMFQGCTSLTTAPELPATTLAPSCYNSMFYNCSSLTTAPELPATTLAYYCYGHMFHTCTSLTTAPVLPATTLTQGCYNGMLIGCTSLTTAPVLPATTLADECYGSMFNGCTSLTTAPVLPATTLAYHCYNSMFIGCTSLTTAPVLPATTLAYDCYGGMFYGCTALTTAPELPATTLADWCYSSMFQGCTSLNYIKCLATDISATSCTYGWVDGVAASGTFVKATSMSNWTTGTDGIPSGWTVQNDHDYSQDYLTFEALESGNITWKAIGTGSPSKIISYSINDGAWTSISSMSAGNNISVSTGDKVRFKGNESSYATSNNVYSGFENQSGAKFNIYGNIMSLIYGDNFIGQTSFNGGTYNFCSIFKKSCVVSAENLILPATTLTGYCYRAMFSNATLLEKAPELPATTLAEYCYYYMFENTKITTAPVLPATTLATYCYANMFRGCSSLTTAPELPATTLVERCYDTMFRGCSSLTTAPALPATTLAGWCYGSMFHSCISLTTAPELPATTLADTCYQYMFRDCSSLTTAPALPATTLVNNCYQYMFNGCTSLNYIKCLATNTSAGGTTNWVTNVSPTGTFVKDASMSSWTTGNNGIPSGWTVQNA